MIIHVNSTNRGGRKKKNMTPSFQCSFTVLSRACNALICPRKISSPLVKPLEGFFRRCVLIRMTCALTIGCYELHTWAVTFSILRPKRDTQYYIVTEQTHSQRATDWSFSAVWEPWRDPVCRNKRGVEFIYSVRRSSYSHMDRPTVISLDCTAPNKSAPALTGLFLTCCETMM